MKNILFLVTGMTPQIITETVWALACDPELAEPWVPDEIHVLSTESGLNQIRSRLFSEKEGFKFKKFKQEYPQLQAMQFDGSPQYLHVIKDDKEQTLNDLRTPTDNEVAANVICAKIREFTLDDEVELHVSIAGGRKTMGFYAGYALSLYGRVRDSMSHVLVEESFEKAVDFFYPTVNSYLVSDRDKKVVGDAKNAKVWLAQISFVRMKDAIKERHQLHSENHQSFSSVVEAINKSFEPITLTLYIETSEIQVNNDKRCHLPARLFAFLHWFVVSSQNNASIAAPTISKNEYPDDETARKKFSKWSDPFNKLYNIHKIKPSIVIVDKNYFEVSKSKLKAELVKKLGGLEMANRIMPIQDEITNEFHLPSNINLRVVTN